jgi:hypothetical protein
MGGTVSQAVFDARRGRAPTIAEMRAMRLRPLTRRLAGKNERLVAILLAGSFGFKGLGPSLVCVDEFWSEDVLRFLFGIRHDS